jgi:hypothetical protein
MCLKSVAKPWSDRAQIGTEMGEILAMWHPRQLLKLFAAPLILVALFVTCAYAQDGADGSFSQIKLTEEQVKNFLAAQPDLIAMDEKLEEVDGEPTPAMEAELDAMATKHGFEDFEELNTVSANVSLVMAGMNPETGEFIQPKEAFKKELDDIKADDSIPAADKKELVEELTEAIETTPSVEHMENVELIKANREAIEKALE